MKYLEDSRLTQLTSDLTGALLNTRGPGGRSGSNAGVRSAGSKFKDRSKGDKSKGENTLSSSPPYLSYSPEGYTSYGGQSGSCRAVYGRVEAYTTKRAASDKKTAHEVGETYANEMKRLNEAVEALKQKHVLDQRRQSEEESEGGSEKMGAEKDEGESRKVARRQRSRSLDGVTFSTADASRMVYDKTENAAAMLAHGQGTLEPLEEGVAAPDGDIESLHAKRHLQPEGILKQPPSNKRSRATSFDISTGPSTIGLAPHYHHSESSSSLLVGNSWSHINATVEEDQGTHPLIPQPSLYQSAESKDNISSQSMVPRRLVTDLILTLNASFPDYDFGSAQVSDFVTLSTPEAVRRINDRLGEFAATTDTGRDFLPRFWGSLNDILSGLDDCEVYSYAPRASSGEDDPLEFLAASMAVDSESDEGSGSGNESDGIVGAEAPAVVFSPVGGGRIVSEDVFGQLDAATESPNRISPSVAVGYGEGTSQFTLWSMNYLFVSKNKKRIVLFACVQTMRTPHGDDADGYDEGDEYKHGENDLVFDEARRGMREEKTGLGSYEEDAYEAPKRFADATRPSPLTLDEAASVMVEDTDVEDGVDVDGDVDQDEKDFDMGASGMSVSVPAQVI